jgi:hypothetical protein
MNLNQYPSQELQTLQLAIAFTKQYAAKEDAAFLFNQLDKWNDRVKEAIKDSAFEEAYRDEESLRIARNNAENNVVAIVEPSTF